MASCCAWSPPERPDGWIKVPIISKHHLPHGTEILMIRPEEIAEGLAKGEFYLEYLPILSLPDLRCIGAEALIRWRRADGSLVMPGEFIPSLESTPASGVLTYWVIETAAAELRDWLRRHPDVHLSLNVPPEIAGRGGVYYAAMKAGLVDMIPQLILEVTERGLPDALALEGLLQAKQLGIRIALDDVNLLGGANLAILSRCPLDIIKVDRHMLAMITPGEAQSGVAGGTHRPDPLVPADGHRRRGRDGTATPGAHPGGGPGRPGLPAVPSDRRRRPGQLPSANPWSAGRRRGPPAVR